MFENIVLKLYDWFYLCGRVSIVLSPLKITDEERVLSELKGKTLLVYWYLLKKGRGSCGVREVQKALGFSSPSSAFYQLEKLRQLGLVVKNRSGNYQVSRVVKTDVMSAFIFFGGCAFPKYLFYALATSLMILLFIGLFSHVLSLIMVAALLPGALAAAIFWYETLKVWHLRPSWE